MKRMQDSGMQINDEQGTKDMLISFGRSETERNQSSAFDEVESQHPGRMTGCLCGLASESNWAGLNWEDYGARWYMPELGRFTGVDPIADEYPHVSVYNYAENSPIGNIDLWGLQKVDANYVGIVGYGNQHKSYDKNAFGQRLKGFGADQSFTVKTGKEFLKALVKASKVGLLQGWL